MLSPKTNNTSLLQRLSDDEIVGFFKDLHEVRQNYQEKKDEDRMSIFIQNGQAAGQTVYQIHSHLISFKCLKNIMEITKNNMVHQIRTLEEMSEEAYNLKIKLNESNKDTQM